MFYIDPFTEEERLTKKINMKNTNTLDYQEFCHADGSCGVRSSKEQEENIDHYLIFHSSTK